MWKAKRIEEGEFVVLLLSGRIEGDHLLELQKLFRIGNRESEPHSGHEGSKTCGPGRCQVPVVLRDGWHSPS